MQEFKKHRSPLLDQALERMYELMKAEHVDFHIRTTHSDGFASPASVVEYALKNQVDVISVTDRDTVQAVMDIQRILHKLDLVQLKRPVFVPGVEVAADYAGQDIRILAYFPVGGEYRLEDFLLRQQASRDQRNKAMCDRLEAMGCPIKYSDLRQVAQTIAGREHMALILVRESYSKNTVVCFQELLARGKAAFVERELDDVGMVLDAIRQAGGIPVLSNPCRSLPKKIAVTRENFLSWVEPLYAMGLDGLETIRADMSEEQMGLIASVAKELNMLRTAGSDFQLSYGEIVRMDRNVSNYQRFLE